MPHRRVYPPQSTWDRRLWPSQLRRPPRRQDTPAPLVACDESVGWDRKSRIRDECNGMRARERLQQSQAIPSAPWKYNARVYGRGLSKITHLAYSRLQLLANAFSRLK